MIKKYTASEGKTFIRKIDRFIMGSELFLLKFIDGSEDSIDNYEEIDDPDTLKELEYGN